MNGLFKLAIPHTFHSRVMKHSRSMRHEKSKSYYFYFVASLCCNLGDNGMEGVFRLD